MKKALLMFGAAALVVGCDDPFPDDNGDDTGDFDIGSAELQWISEDCVAGEGSHGRWHYEAETDWWIGPDAELQIDENATPAWHEVHDMPSADHDPDDPTWDYLYRSLDVVTTVGAQNTNQSSLFGCDLWGQMMWMLSVWDFDGNFSDCAVWSGPTGNVGIYDSYNCLNWN